MTCRSLLPAVLVALVLVAVPALAERPMAPEDLYAITRVSDPRVSPDGLLVAFTATAVDLGENESNSDIWLVPMTGGVPRQLTRGAGADHSPQWSPDGTRLAFISDREGTADLYVIPVAGGEARRVTSSETDLNRPAWSRDGRFLVCGSRVVPEGASRENWTAEDLPECEARTIDRLLFRQWNRWLGDERDHVFLVDAADGSMRDLTPGDFDTPPVSLASGHDFDLSPDGKRLIFVRNDAPDTAMSTNHGLWLVEVAEGAKPRKLTDNPALDSAPVFSPDGRSVAYLAMATPGFEADTRVVHVLDLDSGETRALTADLDRSARQLVWAPDGRRLFFTARDGGRGSVYSVDLDGRVTRLMNEGYASHLSVSPRGDRLVFVRSRVHEPAELYSFSREDGTTRRLTGFNADLVAELDLPHVEEITFVGADGDEVHGFLQRPPGFDPSRKYPLLLVIHGGPQGMWADRFMTTWFTFPLATAPGYVGLFINPRGSSGYGSTFREQVSLDYGGRCYQDLMLGVDWVLEHYDFVDPSRLAAIGGSFGGYAVNWIMGHTERFACLVSHAGLYNLVSFYGATEELWFPAWDMGETPWDEPELYARWSPHRHAAKFSTPTLVTHGELDYRVPFAESLQLFTALQRQGVPSRLVVFPDDGHVIQAPQNNVRWWREIHRWLAAYLAEPAEN